MRIIGLILVWLGVALQLVFMERDGDALFASMALSGLGLVLFHHAKGHRWTVMVLSASSALLPVFGPLLALRIKPRGQGASSWRLVRGGALFAVTYTVLAIMAMGGFGFVRFPAPARAAFWSSTDMELLSLRPKYDSRHGGGANFHDNEILGAITVRGVDKGALLVALALGVSTNPGTVAMCFNPRHGLRVTHQGQVHELEICFECLQILVHFGEPKAALSTTSALPESLFNAMLARRGVEISPHQRH